MRAPGTGAGVGAVVGAGDGAGVGPADDERREGVVKRKHRSQLRAQQSRFKLPI